MKTTNTLNMLWGILPACFAIIWTFLEFNLSQSHLTNAVNENGAIELLQFLILIFGLLICLYKFFKIDTTHIPFIKAIHGLFAVGFIYIAGEEVSWGQWFFFWETPEIIMLYNDQGETNIHNMSSWLDQKPKTLIQLGIVMSGIILPIILRYRSNYIPKWLENLLPPFQAIFTASIYCFVKIIDEYCNFTGAIVYTRASEIIEVIIYYYLVLYVGYLGIIGNRLDKSKK